jgi:Cd2+/Zn2+-exporting ATPase
MAVIALSSLLPVVRECGDCRKRFVVLIAERLKRSIPADRDIIDLSDEERAAAEGIAAELLASHDHASFRVTGMDCASCVRKVETAVKRDPGVTGASVSLSAERMVLELQKGADPATAVEAVRKLGYQVDDGKAQALSHDHHDHDHSGHDHAGHSHAPVDLTVWWKTGEAAAIFLSGLLIALGLGLEWSGTGYSLYAYVPAATLSLVPILRKAFAAARSGTPFSIEMLVSIASIGAFFINAVAEAAVVAFLFTIGEMLEGLAAAKARSGIQALAALVPQTASVIEAGTRREVAVADLQPGMIVEVAPGGRIPCDGDIVMGTTSIDQSPVTGESVPVAKQVGDDVFAGSINTDGVIRISVTKASANNTIARIIELVEQAEGARSPTARFIDRFSSWYTPAVALISLLVILVPPLGFGADWNTWIYRGLTLLLIACPCALVLSVPAAITSGLAAGARRGLLMKGGAVLERIGSAKIVALDKTGTLTEGRPSVTDISAVDGDEANLLTLAAAVEQGSSHPLAKAIVAAAQVRDLTVPEATAGTALPGIGVRAQVGAAMVQIVSPRHAEGKGSLTPEIAASVAALEEEGKTVVVVLRNTRLIGTIALRDEPRADAASAMQALKAMGIRPVMLTGDNSRTAAAIGKTLDLEPRGDLMPADKLAAIEALRKNGVVVMVGDGINDAPALAKADIGIAMGKGTHVALETADAALLHDRIGGLVSMIRLSRATMSNIKQNVVLALGLKAVFLVTTLLGETGLWMAVLADTGGTVLVTINALRLLRFKD